MSIPFCIVNYYGYGVNFLQRMDRGGYCWELEAVENSTGKPIFSEKSYSTEIDALSSMLKYLDKIISG